MCGEERKKTSRKSEWKKNRVKTKGASTCRKKKSLEGGRRRASSILFSRSRLCTFLSLSPVHFDAPSAPPPLSAPEKLPAELLAACALLSDRFLAAPKKTQKTVIFKNNWGNVSSSPSLSSSFRRAYGTPRRRKLQHERLGETGEKKENKRRQGHPKENESKFLTGFETSVSFARHRSFSRSKEKTLGKKNPLRRASSSPPSSSTPPPLRQRTRSSTPRSPSFHSARLKGSHRRTSSSACRRPRPS